VAAFSARGATREGILEAAKGPIASGSGLVQPGGVPRFNSGV
jgi:hypothetical protein